MAQRNEIATNITARINVMGQAVPNVDINYGPYTSVDDAFDTLSTIDAIAIGLTVGIQENNTIQEYWFKDGTQKSNLVPKLAESGVSSYTDLTNKPKINGHELVSTNTLNSIGVTPMSYGPNSDLIKSFSIVDNKLTITVGATSYDFRLETWHDIADFYVLWGNPIYSDGNWKLEINGVDKNFTDITGDEFLTLAIGDEVNGYMVTNNKTEMNLPGYGNIMCDYIKDLINSDDNPKAMFLMTRKSGNNQPILKIIASTDNTFSNYYFNSGDEYGINNEEYSNDFNNLMEKNVTINQTVYSIQTVYEVGGLGKNKYGIKYIK